jgi:hypothetical protein
LKTLISHIKNVMFIKGDHFIANKNPEEFNRAVVEFLQA